MRAIALIVAITVIVTVVVTSGTPARGLVNSQPYVFRAPVSADAYVDSNNASTNYGTANLLKVGTNKGGIIWNIWLRFPLDIPDNANVIEAWINLWPYDWSNVSSNGLAIDAQPTCTYWSETTINWNNVPSLCQGTTSSVGRFVVDSAGEYTRLPARDFVAYRVGNFFQNASWMLQLSSKGSIATCGQCYARFPSRVYAGVGTDFQPFITALYTLPTATIYPSYFCSGGPCETGTISGSGLPAYLFNVSYAENNGTFRRAPRPDLLLTNLSTYYTLRVSDFFGNILYNTSKVVTSTTFVWIVAIPYGIFQVYSMRDTFTSLSIKPAGGTAMVIDIPPRAWWALPLKSQVAYWLNFTILDANFNAIATINIIRTMGTKLSFIVNGTTLSQISMNQNGNWETTNLTRGSTYAIGNIMSAPHGIDLFQNYWTLHAWGVPIPVTLWLISVIVLGISWGGWGFTYRGKLGRRIHRWPRKAKLISGFILIPLSSTLLVAFIVHLAGGSVFIPIPWAPITSMIPGLSFVVPVDTDPDDPGDGGGDGDGDGKGDPHDVKGPDIYVRVLHEDDDIVRLLVTLTQGARAQFRERGVDWLEDVIRNGVRRSFADHPLHRPFRRTGHVDPRPAGEHGGNGEGRGFDR